MSAPKKEKIYGYVDLTNDFRAWKEDQYLNHGKKGKHLAAGWKVCPAHHRENPNHGIIKYGYPDVEESHLYWFDNPLERDENNEIDHLPLPIKSQRDKEWFREENEKMRGNGYYRYVILDSRRKYVS